MNNLGNAYNSIGQYQRAIEYHQQSLAIKREIGDRHGEAQTLQNLAHAYHLTGRVQEGSVAAYQASQIYMELELPLEAWNIPKWTKSIAKFAQRGRSQFILCFIAGVFAFPFALIALICLILWRILRSRVRRLLKGLPNNR